MMMKIKVAVVSVLLLTCATCFTLISLVADIVNLSTKKAIIILPGLFASALYDTKTGNAVWDPFTELDIDFAQVMDEEGAIDFGYVAQFILSDSLIEHLNKLFENDCYGADDSLFNMIAMNEDGTSFVPTIAPVPWTDQSRLRYGVINAQREMCEYLIASYGRDYAIEVFNYDFRLDIRYNGEKLEEYINARGFDEVILIAHSNGGPVVSTYLGRSQENRDKVKKFISYCSPFLGSFAAITILENMMGMISSIAEIPELSFISEGIAKVFERQFMRVANMWTVYQLLPSYELLTTKFKGDQSAIYLDGERLEFESKEELWEYYCTRPWARMSNGELRPAMAQWLEFSDSMYVEVDGKKVHATELVDTTYFSGTGKLGGNIVHFTTNFDNSYTLESEEKTPYGDGVVLLTSATAGVKDPNKIMYLVGYDHYSINVSYTKAAGTQTSQAIDEYLEKSKTPLQRAFGIGKTNPFLLLAVRARRMPVEGSGAGKLFFVAPRHKCFRKIA